MQAKPVIYILNTLLLIAGLSFCSLLYADQYDLLPVQQNRKVLRLNGNVIGMKEQKFVLTRDTAIYNTVTNINLDDKLFIMVRSEEAAFDANGNILSLKTSALVDAKHNKMKDSTRLFYYKDDRLTGIQYISENRRNDSFEFHYLKKGLLDYYRLTNGSGGVEYKITYVYKDKKVFTVRKKNKDNFAIAMIKFKYKDDKVSEWQYYDEQFRNTETRRFSYRKNKEGNTDESHAVLDANGTLKGGMTTLKDSSGNILEQSVIDSSRVVTAYFNYEYDTHQNRIKEKMYLGMEQANIENRYLYDEQGNWIRKEVFTNDILTAVITRSYNYGG